MWNRCSNVPIGKLETPQIGKTLRVKLKRDSKLRASYHTHALGFYARQRWRVWAIARQATYSLLYTARVCCCCCGGHIAVVLVGRLAAPAAAPWQTADTASASAQFRLVLCCARCFEIVLCCVALRQPTAVAVAVGKRHQPQRTCDAHQVRRVTRSKIHTYMCVHT